MARTRRTKTARSAFWPGEIFFEDPEKREKADPRLSVDAGHYAGPWVPSIRGVIEKYSDLIKKAVAAITVEHLVCREWMDDRAVSYREGRVERRDDAGQVAGNALVEALQGSRDRAASSTR